MKHDLFTTLIEAKNYLEAHRNAGVDCPCCGQYYKVWRKKPISAAVASLCRLVAFQLREDRYYHLDAFNVIPKDRNFSQLILWHLITPMHQNEEDEEKRASGSWKATEKGIAFALGKIEIPKYVFTLDNKLIAVSEETISVHKALSMKFSYADLMSDNYVQRV